MRTATLVLSALMIGLCPAAAEDEKKGEPKKPAKEMTEAEREAALKEASELNTRVETLYAQGKYREATPKIGRASCRERV